MKILIILLIIYPALLLASQFTYLNKPSKSDAIEVCNISITSKPWMFYDLNADTKVSIYEGHSVDIDNDGIKEIVKRSEDGSIHQPTISIRSISNPYGYDPRYPGHVSERHDRSSRENSYSVIKYNNQIYFVNFWKNNIDSVDLRVISKRNSDNYTFPTERWLCEIHEGKVTTFNGKYFEKT